MRTITLELLRHGPPNNQLLSPLTPYLALCGNHSPVTVNVPFEHNQFLHRLSALSYKHGESPRNFYIHDTAQVLGELLSEIPGLTAELNRHEGSGERLTHLRLIISSSELALLPFELSMSPNGFPGAGQHMLLQSQTPICVTREVRRVPELPLDWPTKPRILLIAASPPGFEPVPLQSHLLALRKAIDPWISLKDTSEKINDHLIVIPEATDLAIETACAENDFTHIHILAHGVEYQTDYDVRFGLALHNTRNPDDRASIVDGARLSTILRATRQPEINDLARPAVVTLASCNSGNQGSVAGAGASIAHALHDAGVPIVVASQFPLSFEGSVRMVEVLYNGLLWGEDPRMLLSDLRRRLHSQFPQNHDWAGVTAYAALPQDIEKELLKMKLLQSNRSINVALSMADKVTFKFYDSIAKSTKSNRDRIETTDRDTEEAQRRIEFAKKKLNSLLLQPDANKAEIYGHLASTEKRQAEIMQEESDKSVKLLQRAGEYYWEAFQSDRANNWGVVQYLSLLVVLSRLFNGAAILDERQKKFQSELWILAHAISLRDLQSRQKESRSWAIGNLVELHLLATIMDDWPGKPPQSESDTKAREFAAQLLETEGEASFMVYSTQRQMARYVDWYPRFSNLDSVQGLASALVEELPSTWDDSNK